LKVEKNKVVVQRKFSRGGGKTCYDSQRLSTWESKEKSPNNYHSTRKTEPAPCKTPQSHQGSPTIAQMKSNYSYRGGRMKNIQYTKWGDGELGKNRAKRARSGERNIEILVFQGQERNLAGGKKEGGIGFGSRQLKSFHKKPRSPFARRGAQSRWRKFGEEGKGKTKRPTKEHQKK